MRTFLLALCLAIPPSFSFADETAAPPKKPVRVYVLLGGMWGPDGYVFSRGMIGLAGRIAEIPGVSADVRVWSDYPAVAREIARLPAGERVVLVGYSGGGSRATWIADALGNRPIDLIVAYDPSPKWQMKGLHANVKHAVSYHNLNPMFMNLGGGIMTGHNVLSIDISEPHLSVQSDEALHRRTLQLISALVRQSDGE
jgi:hypothetical protein